MPFGIVTFVRRDYIMLKQAITYTDFDGNERTENFYFNLSLPELIELYVEYTDVAAYIQGLIDNRKTSELIGFIKMLIRKSYGVKSDDGRRFIKSDESSDEFMQTNAYSELFTSFCIDSGKAAQFINSIIPNNIDELVKRVSNNNELKSV